MTLLNISLTVLLTFIFTTTVSAHCPALYPREKICFMLDQNILYVYDKKFEHNGPYKDLVAGMKIMDTKGEIIKYERSARGIYKLRTTAIIKQMSLELKDQSGVKKILIKAD